MEVFNLLSKVDSIKKNEVTCRCDYWDDDYNDDYNDDSYSEIIYWDCEICGGNQDTGCLYHSPSECPKAYYRHLIEK